MKKYLFTLLFLVSTLSFSNIFNEKDSINISTGIETTKFPSGLVDINYEFEPKDRLIFQVGNQIKFMSNRNDWSSTYIGLKLNFKDFDYNSPIELPKKQIDDSQFYLLMRVGLSNDLDSSNSKGYCGIGVQYGTNYFIRTMLESENHKLRNTVSFGIKFKELKFY